MNRISNFVRATAVAAIVLGVATLAHGQVEQKTEPAQKTDPAQGTPQMPMVQGGITPGAWFNNPDVRQQLKLNDDQFNGLSKAYQQAYMNYQQTINGLDKTLPEAQRDQRMKDLQKDFYKELSTTSDKLFTDPTQKQRYNQLFWQYRGYAAFNYAPIADALKLTPDQRERFRQMQQDWDTQMGKLNPLYQTDKAQAVAQFSKMQTQDADRINTVLTPQQQAQWRQMAGTTYVFPPEVYFNAHAPVPPKG